MTPNMSVGDMLDSFIYVVKGSRVIDRRATDWGEAYWLEEKLIKHLIYSVTELRGYFRHRIYERKCGTYGKPKWETIDPFDLWLTNGSKFQERTLLDAMRFADRAARGLVAPIINIPKYIPEVRPPWYREPGWVKIEQGTTIDGKPAVKIVGQAYPVELVK